jgi:hypothetical protein
MNVVVALEHRFDRTWQTDAILRITFLAQEKDIQLLLQDFRLR